MIINLQPVSNVIGALLVIIGLVMLCCIPFGLYYKSGDATALLNSGSITMIVGILCWKYKFKDSTVVNKREGYLIVTLGWVAMVIFGSLPYVFSGVALNWTDGIFESVSGLTTTGASILTDIEIQPKGILVWRSLSQWIGGMGIIVLTVALFPLLGIGGIELFVAEAPGPTSDKIHPRIKEVAKRLWLIYVLLTGVLFVLLFIEGMTGYDAFNHALTTMATGGFSTKNASIAHYDSSLIHYTIAFFMFLAGTNFTVTYFGLKGKWKNVWGSDEFRLYIYLLLILIVSMTLWVWLRTEISFTQSLRDITFQVISLITTTGFITADYTSWTPGLTMICFMLLFVGACAGSTSGGIKLIRHLVFIKNSALEFKRLLHPRALIRIKINKQVVQPRILTHILVFLLVYLGTFVAGTIIVVCCGMDILSAMGAVGTSLGNVGPGIGSVGPIDNFFAVPMTAKWVLSVLMLFGRLELFTVLILFTPYFWKTN